MCVQPCKMDRHVSMVRAHAAAIDEFIAAGHAKVFTMRGKYRQTFLRDGEEMTQSANLRLRRIRRCWLSWRAFVSLTSTHILLHALHVLLIFPGERRARVRTQ
jgi:hypothetical protein